jgi:hypothetical protein
MSDWSLEIWGASFVLKVALGAAVLVLYQICLASIFGEKRSFVIACLTIGLWIWWGMHFHWLTLVVLAVGLWVLNRIERRRRGTKSQRLALLLLLRLLCSAQTPQPLDDWFAVVRSRFGGVILKFPTWNASPPEIADLKGTTWISPSRPDAAWNHACIVIRPLTAPSFGVLERLAQCTETRV